MKKFIILSLTLLLAACSSPKESIEATIAPTVRLTEETTSEPMQESTPESAITEEPVLVKETIPYDSITYFKVDESAVSATYERAVQGLEDTYETYNRFPDYIAVSSVTYSTEYTHFVLTDTRDGTELKFAILTNLPDLNLQITGWDDNEICSISLSFTFPWEVESEKRYGISYLTNQYAFVDGVQYQTFGFQEDYANNGWKGAESTTELGKYTFVTNPKMMGETDKILNDSSISEIDKTALQELEKKELVVLD